MTNTDRCNRIKQLAEARYGTPYARCTTTQRAAVTDAVDDDIAAEDTVRRARLVDTAHRDFLATVLFDAPYGDLDDRRATYVLDRLASGR